MLERHLEKLGGFYSAARTGKLSLAARERGLTQPALTRSIRALEEIVGVRLLERHRRGVALTEEGKILFTYCERLFPEVADLEERLRSPDTLAGVVTIGTYETLGILFWPQALRLMRKRAPKLVVQISTEGANELWHKLEIGALDIIVDAEPVIGEHLFSKVLYQDHFALYQGARYRGPEAGTQDLPMSYVRRASDRNGMTIQEHLQGLGVPHRLLYSFDTFVSVKAVVLEGLAMGVLPVSFAAADARAGRVQTVQSYSPFGAHRICATCLESRRREPKISELFSLLKESAGG